MQIAQIVKNISQSTIFFLHTIIICCQEVHCISLAANTT
jgi:hypothetical protein